MLAGGEEIRRENDGREQEHGGWQLLFQGRGGLTALVSDLG
jgi:hypothetical protein